MPSFASNLLQVYKMADNYDTRKVDRTELENGLVVSTAHTTDFGYETAILTLDDKVLVVERYGWELTPAAQEGHDRWVQFATNGVGKTVKYLGSGGMDQFPEDGEMVL